MPRKITYEEIKKYIESFGYELLSEKCDKAKEKVLLKCPNGHLWRVRYDSFKTGNRCPECRKKNMNEKFKRKYEEVKEYIESFGYELLSDDYINGRSLVLVRCPNGHEYKVNFNNFKTNNRRCPICNISKGERRIMDWLEENDIEYIYDKEYFEDLNGIGGGLLRPDFIIEDKKIWIEFDGKFHYEKIYDENDYEKLKIHDRLKNQYAKENGWKLIRIPYWDFDKIEEILNKELER